MNPRTVSQAYGELEREGVVYVRRGQGTFVAPGAHPGRDERRTLARGVAKRALLEARRSGLGVEELLTTIREVAAEAEGEPSPPASAPARAGIDPRNLLIDVKPADNLAEVARPGT